MATTFIAKTVLEYAVQPIQSYEFTCGLCFMVRPWADHSIDYRGGSGSYHSCIHCEPGKTPTYRR